jgi:hypothetical protein
MSSHRSRRFRIRICPARSGFVGRGRELDDVRSLLRSSSRLITLAGQGGAGKTRLAIEAAGEVVGGYPAGVFWVGLAPLQDQSLMVETLAQTLGAKDELARHIGERADDNPDGAHAPRTKACVDRTQPV